MSEIDLEEWMTDLITGMADGELGVFPKDKYDDGNFELIFGIADGIKYMQRDSSGSTIERELGDLSDRTGKNIESYKRGLKIGREIYEHEHDLYKVSDDYEEE